MFSCFGNKAMKALENSTGEGIWAKYVIAGKPLLVAGKLRSVSRFRHVEIETLNTVKTDFLGNASKIIVSTSLLKIPFIGIKVAIQRIEKGGSNEIIYDNFLIPDYYNLANSAGVLELAELFYGQAAQSG